MHLVEPTHFKLTYINNVTVAQTTVILLFIMVFLLQAFCVYCRPHLINLIVRYEIAYIVIARFKIQVQYRVSLNVLYKTILCCYLTKKLRLTENNQDNHGNDCFTNNVKALQDTVVD